jgi:hypothetical protein
MAWTHTVPASLLFRDGSGGDVIAEAVPFQPYSAVWHGDDVILTGSDGVWSWRPGRPVRKIAALPHGVIVESRDGLISIDPLPIVDGRLVRSVLATGWDVNVSTGAVAERLLSSSGQRWCRAANEHAVATTFPDADRIELSGEDEPLTLVWARPRAAVWLGSSLLVNTSLGDVVLFPDFAAVLRGCQR